MTFVVSRGLAPDSYPAAVDFRWSRANEVLRVSDADRLLTLTGAHPSARVVRDAALTPAAERRLLPRKR